MRNIDQAPSGVTLAAALLVASCGGAAQGRCPDDMSGASHARASETHEAARQHEAQNDPSANGARESQGGSPARASGDIGTRTQTPTDGHDAAVAEQHQHLGQHIANEQALRQFEGGACRALAPDMRAVCWLLAGVTGVEDVEGGVRIRFVPHFRVEEVLENMRCHFAFARTRGYEGNTGCPLYLRGVEVRAGPGGTVELVASDPATVRTIREQTRVHTPGGADH
jgi:hypothetical protein